MVVIITLQESTLVYLVYCYVLMWNNFNYTLYIYIAVYVLIYTLD